MWKYTGIKECNDFLLSLRLFDYNDEKKYIKTLYSISNNQKDNYKEFKIKKRNGKIRTIYEAVSLLKIIQKRILKYILENKEISSYAKAYHKGISLLDNATPHINKKTILKLDIKDFFDSINYLDIYNACFPIEYFPKSVGFLLTNLCTLDNHLVQGASTSSYISNLVMKDFDEEIGSFCNSLNISYTRYSDDMTFSGDFNPNIVIKKVKEELLKQGLFLNKDKIHVITSSNSQSVTGIIVNKKAQVSVNYRKRIRQEVYYIQKYGLKDHLKRLNITNKGKYLNSLLGRINYSLMINQDDKELTRYQKIIREIMVK